MTGYDTVATLCTVFRMRDLQGALFLRYNAYGTGPHAC